MIGQEGAPAARWTRQAQLVLRHFAACACVALAFQSLVWLILSPILYYQTINQGLKPAVRQISACTCTSTSALDRLTENELTDLVKIAQLAEWMTECEESEKEQYSRRGTIRDSGKSRENLPTYDETKLKFLALLFPIGNVTMQVKRPAVKGALIPCVWEVCPCPQRTALLSDAIINQINWETNQQNPNQAHIDFFNIKKENTNFSGHMLKSVFAIWYHLLCYLENKYIYLLFPIIIPKNIKVSLEDSRGKNSENK